jgi:hypothetical protein
MNGAQDPNMPPMAPPPAGGPPPGPPPPVGGAPTGPTFDFAKPFTFVFEDRDWVTKILIGGLFSLLGVFIIGHIVLLGYFARLVRNVVAGSERPLPEWSDFGEYLGEGLKLFGVVLIYLMPLFGLALMLIVPAALLEGAGHEGMGALFGVLFPLVLVPLAFAVMVFLPAGLLRVVMLGRFSAAFELGEVVALMRASGVSYLLAIAVHLVAGFAAQFGILLCCVGVFATTFWSLAASSHAFAQAYRLAR